MADSKIEWTDKVLNPVTGCDPISPGCAHCYAKRMAQRLAGRFGYPKNEPFRVTFHPERLALPKTWKNPCRIFLNSMGDWMHYDVKDSWIEQIWSMVNNNPQHTFITLTKRPGRLVKFFGDAKYPLPNFWHGISAENQSTYEERCHHLLQVGAAVRFISYEPLLGPITIPADTLKQLDWVIAGGETGPGARECEVEWIGSLWEQAREAGIPFFFKQWGGRVKEYCAPEVLDSIQNTRQFPKEA